MKFHAINFLSITTVVLASVIKCQFSVVFAQGSLGCAAVLASKSLAFEGILDVAITRGGQTEGLRYTVGTNFLRVEMTVTNWPNPVDISDRHSGALTLLFPHNRSFVRLKPTAESTSAPPGFPATTPMPSSSPTPPGNLPLRVGPTNFPGMSVSPPGLPPGVGPQIPSNMPAGHLMPAMPNLPTVGGMPGMPMMPPPVMEPMELTATGDKTNLLGLTCEKFEIKQRGEVMEIWATEQLFAFQNYVRNQPSRFGPQMIEEKWGDLLKDKKLFPLLAVLRFEPIQPRAGNTSPAVAGPERYRFEVRSITPQKLKPEDLKLFQPPEGYVAVEPLPY